MAQWFCLWWEKPLMSTLFGVYGGLNTTNAIATSPFYCGRSGPGLRRLWFVIEFESGANANTNHKPIAVFYFFSFVTFFFHRSFSGWDFTMSLEKYKHKQGQTHTHTLVWAWKYDDIVSPSLRKTNTNLLNATVCFTLYRLYWIGLDWSRVEWNDHMIKQKIVAVTSANK